MNQFFNVTRFNLLVLKHWADNKKRYGLSLLAFISLLITWFVFAMLIDAQDAMSKQMQHQTYFLWLFAAGTFYASQYFRDLGSRAKASNFLLVPASAFEKISCGLLYTVLLFFVVFTAAFYLVDILMIAISKTLGTGELPGNGTLVNVFKVTVFEFSSGLTINFLIFFFSVQSAFLLGSVYFKRYGFIKTIISGFVACFILFCLMYFLYEPPFYLFQGPRWLGQVFRLIIYAMAPFLWIATYYRLKAKQV